jgi:hypothetical protein
LPSIERNSFADSKLEFIVFHDQYFERLFARSNAVRFEGALFFKVVSLSFQTHDERTNKQTDERIDKRTKMQLFSVGPASFMTEVFSKFSREKSNRKIALKRFFEQ